MSDFSPDALLRERPSPPPHRSRTGDVAKLRRATSRPVVRGKFLYADDGKYWVKGMTYGTFAPDAYGQPFPNAAQVERDFAQMARAGMNTVRVYTVPPRTLLDAAHRHGLKVMVGLRGNNTSHSSTRQGGRKQSKDACATACKVVRATRRSSATPSATKFVTTFSARAANSPWRRMFTSQHAPAGSAAVPSATSPRDCPSSSRTLASRKSYRAAKVCSLSRRWTRPRTHSAGRRRTIPDIRPRPADRPRSFFVGARAGAMLATVGLR